MRSLGKFMVNVYRRTPPYVMTKLAHSACLSRGNWQQVATVLYVYVGIIHINNGLSSRTLPATGN